MSMASNDSYLRGILARYSARQGAVAVGNSVRTQISNSFVDVKTTFFSGSYAKGTALHMPGSGSDIDIFISISSTSTLKDIYEYTYQFALARNWSPRRQNVSIGAKISGFDIDLVPGRIQAGSINYHSLYVRKQNSWRQTNVSLHVSEVSKSGRLEEIRLFKLWRNLQGLDFTSFYLEMFALEMLKGRKLGALSENFWYLLKATADSIESIRIVDPSNSGNIISDNISQAGKKVIADAARKSRTKQSWGDIVW